MKPNDVQPNAFSENLHDDEWVAVNAQGTIIGRAGSEDGARRANPNAEAWFSGKQLRDGATARNPFDHDGDGHAGGSRPRKAKVEESTPIVAEEPVAEEPVAEEPVAEEPVAETAEPVAEKPAPVEAVEPPKKISGHKDDPGNTNRKAAAGGHAKQPKK